MKNRIGITANEIMDSGDILHNLEINYLPAGYSKGVAQAGGLPVLIPISEDLKDIRQYVSMIDKLILTGGQNVSPEFYQEKPIFSETLMMKKRDIFELALIEEAIKQDKPIFGICRGMQLLNVYFGGSLIQDLSQRVEEPVKHMQAPISNDIPTHWITTEKGSILNGIYGPKAKVNSFHFQAVNRIGNNLRVTANSEDGIVEGIESHGLRQKIVGVQWHPDFSYKVLEQERRAFNFVVNEM